ncbi:MAG: iron ABC transporter permease [Arcanobacterium sp.]|nr:iron ABC transporter permease [Arcanobacterium sp.]
MKISKFGKVGWGIAAAIPLAFLAVFFLWPVGSILLRGLTAGAIGGSSGVVGEPSAAPLATFMAVFGSARTWKIVWQTVWMALAGTGFSVLFGVPGAYVLYRLKLPAAALWRGLITVPFVLPTVVVGIAFRALLDGEGPLAFLGIGQSTTAVVLAMVFFNFSLIARTVGVMWASLDPRQAEAARTLGATPWRALCTVTLPQLAPAIAAGASLVFLYCATAYGLVTTLGRPAYGTIETEIYVQTVTYLDLNRAALLSLLQFAIVAVALVASSRLTRRTETALHTNTRGSRPPSRTDIPAFLATGVMLLLIVAPMLTLVIRSFRVNGTWSVLNYQLLTASSGVGMAGGTTVMEALQHSLAIATDATWIALAVGLPLSYVLSRRMSGAWATVQSLIYGFVLLPVGISTVTVGFGLLVTLGLGPMAASPWLVPIAQAIVALPLVVRAIVPRARAIDPRTREAASTLGASPLRVLLTIDVPLAARGIVLAFGFAFATSMGEFGATSFVANPQYQTLPVLIVKLLGRPGAQNYGMALAGAVILAIITGTVMMAAEVLLHSDTGQLWWWQKAQRKCAAKIAQRRGMPAEPLASLAIFSEKVAESSRKKQRGRHDGSLRTCTDGLSTRT